MHKDYYEIVNYVLCISIKIQIILRQAALCIWFFQQLPRLFANQVLLRATENGQQSLSPARWHRLLDENLGKTFSSSFIFALFTKTKAIFLPLVQPNYCLLQISRNHFGTRNCVIHSTRFVPFVTESMQQEVPFQKLKDVYTLNVLIPTYVNIFREILFTRCIFQKDKCLTC